MIRPQRGLVTGSARGLGEAIAERLVREGWNVALIDLAPEVKSTAARLATLRDGAAVPAFLGDVADEAFCEDAVRGALETLGGLDALVNNAGVGGPSTPVVEIEATEFRRVLEINLVGSFLMARAAGRAFVQQGTGGAIVNLGSMYGQRGVAGGAAYCASKGGVALLTHSLALELASHGVRVNTIAPGNMATEMHFDDLRAIAVDRDTTFEEELERVRSSIPLARHGTGEDVAGAVAWLLSDDATYVTGQTIGVNGGVLLT